MVAGGTVIDGSSLGASTRHVLPWGALTDLAAAAAGDERCPGDQPLLVITDEHHEHLPPEAQSEIADAIEAGLLTTLPTGVDVVEVLITMTSTLDAALVSNRDDHRLWAADHLADHLLGAVALPGNSWMLSPRGAAPTTQSTVPTALPGTTAATDAEPAPERHPSGEGEPHSPGLGRGVAAIFDARTGREPGGSPKPRAVAQPSTATPSRRGPSVSPSETAPSGSDQESDQEALPDDS